MNNSLLSFIIPLRNNQTAPLEGISNILKTKTDKIQIVVINISSTDDTVLSLQKIKDDRLVIITASENTAYGHNLINAISNASGEYFLILDENDVFLEDSINSILSFLENNNYDVIGVNVTSNPLEPQTPIGTKFMFFLEKVGTLLTSFSRLRTIIRRSLINTELFNATDEIMLNEHSEIYILTTVLDTNICMLSNSFIFNEDYNYFENVQDLSMYLNIVSIWLLYSNITDGEKIIIAYKLFNTFIKFIQVDNEEIAVTYDKVFFELARNSNTYEECQEFLINIATEYMGQISG